MARVGSCRLNNKGVAEIQRKYRESQCASVAAFCAQFGITRSTYYSLIGRRIWFEPATVQGNLDLLGIPRAEQAALSEFRGSEPPLPPHNLPLHLTSFVGREREITQVKKLLLKTRLLTLRGTGGCGKTRLSQQVAKEVLERFPDGVWVVELAQLADHNLVPQTVASVLGLKDQNDKSITQTLTEHLQEKRLLLLLDNCEHLLSACTELATALLHTCTNVKILTTSRQTLGIAGEQNYRVPSLTLPAPSRPATVESILRCESVQLFLDRATLRNPDFVVTDQSAPALASLCRRLDGIPLGIELAAAQVCALSVEEIDTHLSRRLHLLTEGNKRAPPRHQTLQAAIDWSYDLLTAQERWFLALLSVFAGGWTLNAAEQVMSNKVDTRESIPEWEILDLLSSLEDKSLIIAQTQGQTTRYSQLETIRQYGLDRLAESEENEPIRACHRDYFLALAEEAEPKLRGPKQSESLKLLETEHENLRSALEWSLSDAVGTGEALRLCGALQGYWCWRGYLTEGRNWCERALQAKAGELHRQARAKTLFGAGDLAHYQGDHRASQTYFEESLAICREIGDRYGVAFALNGIGNALKDQGNYAAAQTYFEESLTIYQEIGNLSGAATSLLMLGWSAEYQGNYPGARANYEKALSLYQTTGSRRGMAKSLTCLGDVANCQGAYSDARAYLEESLTLHKALEDRSGIAWALNSLGNAAHGLGHYDDAKSYYEQSEAINREIGAVPREA